MEESPSYTSTWIISPGQGLIQSDWALVLRDVFLKELLSTGEPLPPAGTMEMSAQPGFLPQSGKQGAPLKEADVVLFVLLLPFINVGQSRCSPKVVALLGMTFGNSERSQHKRNLSLGEITHDVNHRASLSHWSQDFIPCWDGQTEFHPHLL